MHGNARRDRHQQAGRAAQGDAAGPGSTFAIATLAITGIVPLPASSPRTPSSTARTPRELHGIPLGGHTASGCMGLLTALCTAFYMTRLYFLTFEGKRAPDARVPHAHESGWPMTSAAGGAGRPLGGRRWCYGIPHSCPARAARRSGADGELPRPGVRRPRTTSARTAALRDRRSTRTPRRWALGCLAWAIALIGGAAAWLLYRRLPARAGSRCPRRMRAAAGAGRGTSSTWTSSTTSWSSVPFNAFSSCVLYKVVDALLIDTRGGARHGRG